ncbi:aminopeptidase YpdF [Rhodococcus aetherivorans]|uniref:Aminopeptidase YpdF n=1 Tax=Rhodococcus aetherivorans TaxID=191292 RepID=A0ABQ0YFB8_9NOCA|nr:M24 family metallopeptidase [Rhodococcus aetherivorans]ETT25636.1 peptidase M24 [Rhodococcus rhodochrous ATCC 21198]NGP26180.1 aminopeptidase P family protein [Rhodococcus aetherivorans]GES35235.1 aminopeptidase YpdF [Rhodococcus aetherivorans]
MIATLAERDRRWRLLHERMERDGYDALLFAAADYRGHKGALRYLADYNLSHRFGYAVLHPGAAPTLVLPKNLEGGRRPRTGWIDDYVYAEKLSEALVKTLTRGAAPARVGIVGMGQVMKVEDYLHLTEELPGTVFEDASAMFEQVRAVKTAAEIRGAEESAYISDRCFERLLEIARPGTTERAVAAEMYRVAYSLGAEDPLFLTMYADDEPTGPCPTFGAPGGRELTAHDVFIFSYELVGPAGYWMELSRMVTFAPPTPEVQRLADAVCSGLAAGSAALRPGTTMSGVQRDVIAAIEQHGVRSSYWSGHGLGLDVLEEPWVGLEMVQDNENHEAVTATAEGMVIALHPMLWDADSGAMGYMADTCVVEAGRTRTLSKFPTELYRV